MAGQRFFEACFPGPHEVTTLLHRAVRLLNRVVELAHAGLVRARQVAALGVRGALVFTEAVSALRWRRHCKGWFKGSQDDVDACLRMQAGRLPDSGSFPVQYLVGLPRYTVATR